MTTTPRSIVDRFHPRLQAKQQAAVDSGHIQKIDEVELLEQEQLLPLARLSLRLLLLGGLCFGILNYAAYAWREHSFGLHLSVVGVLIWLAINFVGYFVMLPLHELVHGAAILLWGGKPHLGVKLPYALYCGARNQFFGRDQYLVVALTPLVVISLAGIVFTLLWPVLASYTLSMTVGNISGAAGDVWSARRVARLPATALIEDTEAGYRAWELTEQ